jgi:hypothetical protein
MAPCSLVWLNQWTQLHVANSRSSTVRNGPSTRTHSVLYKPMTLSAMAIEAVPDGADGGHRAGVVEPQRVADRRVLAARIRMVHEKWRTGSEGRISHLKRDWAWRRTRLRGHTGATIWCGHGVFGHNLRKITELQR